MSSYYVYELWNPIKNEPFYVGKGTVQKNGKRSRFYSHLLEARQVLNKRRRSSHKTNTILNILHKGYEIENRIVFETEEHEKALVKEKELIAKYGRRDLGTGSLTNLTDGGDKFEGFVWPQWLKDIASQRNTGEGNPMYGKHHSEKSRHQISTERKERIANGQIIPTKHSDEWKKHLREDNAGGKSLAMPIYAIDKNGNIAHEFQSVNAAATFFNGNSGNICLAANEKKEWNSYGFYWRYKAEYDPVENFNELESKRIVPRQKKSLLQLKNGVLIKEWISIKQALDAIHGNYPMITASIRSGKEYRGFNWSFTTQHSPNDCKEDN